MKNTILIFFAFFAMAQSSIAQSTDTVTFQITISDPNAISHYTNAGLPVFGNSYSNINSILSTYDITRFTQAYTNARSPYLRKIYSVRCNSMALAAALKSADSALFPAYAQTGAPEIFSAFYPNDWSNYPNENLEYIGAPKAWWYNKGNPDVIIGITDTYFDEAHPDFINTGGANKIAHRAYNAHPSTSTKSVEYVGHGTLTAGLIASATHNTIGYPAIGFDCRLDISNYKFGIDADIALADNEVLEMSKRGVRIFNGSWGYSSWSQTSLSFRDKFFFDGQEVYNEIYENGMFAVFAAGNGWGSLADPQKFRFPASFNHNFSTTTIGTHVYTTPPTYPHTDITWNVKDVFELYKGNPSFNNQNNSRVDICAPGLTINGLWYDYSDPAIHYSTHYPLGTSLASPLVAGTAGLLQSALKNHLYPAYKDANYSPYQLEYILKHTANPSVLSKTENLPYTGKLGAGALNAGLAVEKVATGFSLFKPNAAATQTLYIKGVDINTVCAPGSASNGVLPKLTPIIINGTPPYTYVWEPVPGLNDATLDDENIAEPTVISVGASNELYYRLTVYDNSKLNPTDATATAQKTAMKTFKIKFKTSGYDLAMRDSYMDMFNERNDQMDLDSRENNPYQSPDIWNRLTADGISTHQNPDYFLTPPNYAYTRVRNVGCAPSSADSKLRIYWTLASTGENWDFDWKTGMVLGASGGYVSAGGDLTPPAGLSIPVLQPGESTILNQAWHPANPAIYSGSPDKINVCFLARIEEPAYYADGYIHPFGMTIPELYNKNVVTNVWNNNNIVTRNFWIVDLNPVDDKITRRISIANAEATAQVFNFEFASNRSVFRHFAGDFSSIGSVTFYLGDLYDVWVNAGSLGTVASSNAQARTVTFDGANTMRLENLSLAANQRFDIEVEFQLDSPIVIDEMSVHTFYARQYKTNAPSVLYGGGDYEVHVSPSTGNYRIGQNDSLSTGSIIPSFKVAPNPTKGIVRISYNGEKDNATEILITDMVGKKVMTDKITFSPGSSKEINLSRFATGTYLINISNANGINEVYKVVKE